METLKSAKETIYVKTVYESKYCRKTSISEHNTLEDAQLFIDACFLQWGIGIVSCSIIDNLTDLAHLRVS